MQQIDNLTSLRFFAAFAVFISHARVYLTHTGNDTVSWVAHNVLPEGFIGVTFFYVLSGFILNFSYSRRLSEKSVKPADFLFFRFARLYPVHFIFLLAAVPLNLALFPSLSHSYFGMGVFGVNALLLQSWFPRYEVIFSFNEVSWSLSDEMFFYCIFCLFVGFSQRALLFMLGVALLLVAVSMAACNYESCSTLMTQWLFYINPLFRLVDFLIGVILSRIYCARLNKEPLFPPYVKYASVIVLFLLVFVALVAGIDIVWRYDLYYLIPMALIVYSFAEGPHIFPRPIKFLGHASFAFYMCHLLVMRYHERYAGTADIYGPSAWLVFVEIMFLSILFSCLVYQFYERPVNQWLRRYWAMRVRRNLALLSD